MKIRTFLGVLAVILALGAVGWARWQSKPRAAMPAAGDRQLVVSTTAKRQDLLITVTQTGVVEAKSSTPVIPDVSGRLQWVCENGIVVFAGDTVARLDPRQFQEQLTELTVRYGEALRRQEQAQTVARSRMKEMRLRLQRSEDDVAAFERQQQVALQQMADSIAFREKELERRREDLAVKRRLARKGLIAGTEVEREEASVKALEFSLQRERNDYELKKYQSAADALERRETVTHTTRDMSRTRSWSERDVRMSGNEVENLELQVERAREDVAKTTIAAPVDGLVVLTSQGGWRGETNLPRRGDWASQGREIASIVSLDEMQVKLELDQTQITGVRMGQEAEVSIEALPGKVLTGKVSAIGQNARRPPIQGWRGLSSTATFPVTIDLPPIGKALIRPGMRAGVRLVAKRIPDVVTVPAGCIFARDGRHVVFAERDGRFVQVAVTPGESNGEYTAILKGLKEGEMIALNDLGAAPPTGTPTKEPPK
jgi:RND family efflux transporter MFP subunit